MSTDSSQLGTSTKRNLTAEERSKLERDLLTQDPEKVKLPTGETLREYQERQVKEQTEAREAAEKDLSAKIDKGEIRIPTSAVIPDSVIEKANDGTLRIAPGSPTQDQLDKAGLPVTSSAGHKEIPAESKTEAPLKNAPAASSLTSAPASKT